MAQAVSDNMNMLIQDSPINSGLRKDAADFENILDAEIGASTNSTEISADVSENIIEGSLLDTAVDVVKKTVSQIISETISEISAENALNITLEKNVNITPENPDAEDSAQEDTTQIGEEEMQKTTITNEALLLSQYVQQSNIIDIGTRLQNNEEQSNNSPINEEGQTLNLIENQSNSFNKDFEYYSKNVLKSDFTKQELSQKEETKTLKDIVSEEKLEELNIESLETQSSSSDTKSDLMQNQTPQEHGVKAMLGVEESRFDKVEESIQQGQKTNDVNPSKLLEQITKQIENIKNGSKVNMVLNPERLGKVALQIMNTKDGLSALFTVNTTEARNLLMQGLDGLKETLLTQGVSVDNVSVKLNEAQESEYNADWLEQEKEDGAQQERNKNSKNQKNKNIFEDLLSLSNSDEINEQIE